MPVHRLRVELAPALPRLAWVASVPRVPGEVRAVAGAGVERGDDFLVEGVWDGPFESGRFDRSDAFFGSGLRLAGERVALCASTSPVDRLLLAELPERTIVGNSLPVVLAALGARLEAGHDYWTEMGASRLGIGTPTHPLRIRHPRLDALRQVFHGNWILDAAAGGFELRGDRRSFGGFDDYVGALRATLGAIGDNLRSPARRTPMAPVALVSAGYDSPAVACLAAALGVREAFATRPGEGADADLEDGAAVAAALGLETRPLRHGASATSELELEFLAATVWGSELALHELARELASRPGAGLVLSGHNGGVIWEGRADRPEPDELVKRGSDDGLGLTEVRLVAGFVHAAVPFLFARSARDVRRISLSAEMAPWRLGSRYDRPIPRRILEEAGVPRSLFAQRKRGVWEATHELPHHPPARERFVAWLDRTMPRAALRLRTYRALTALDRALVRRLWRLSPRRPLRLPFGLQRLPLRGSSSRQLLFRWANDELAERRSTALAGLDRFLLP